MTTRLIGVCFFFHTKFAVNTISVVKKAIAIVAGYCGLLSKYVCAAASSNVCFQIFFLKSDLLINYIFLEAIHVLIQQ